MQTLKKKRDFQAVFHQGRWITERGNPLKVRVLEKSELRYAIATPRRSGSAVRRNKARRQVREILREWEPKASRGMYFMFIATKQFVGYGFHEKKRRIEKIILPFVGRQN
jgi:ribonuclease P protein component